MILSFQTHRIYLLRSTVMYFIHFECICVFVLFHSHISCINSKHICANETHCPYVFQICKFVLVSFSVHVRCIYKYTFWWGVSTIAFYFFDELHLIHLYTTKIFHRMIEFFQFLHVNTYTILHHISRFI